MHILTILAFALLFWRPGLSPDWVIFSADNVTGTVVFIGLQPVLLGLAGAWVSRRTRRLIRRQPDTPQVGQHFYHRATSFLRFALLALFGASIALTPWPSWFDWMDVHPVLQIVGDLVILLPFFVGATVLFVAAYPLERGIRHEAVEWLAQTSNGGGAHWGLRRYLDFNVRHHLLVIAAPMTLILFAANLTQGYEHELRQVFRWSWAPDAILGVSALLVFVFAPLMLRNIWRTHPLEPGAVRTRLERLCGRTGMHCRDILVWEADGFLINAAVMGVIAPVRFVLLSDALLATMSARQVEAVFGHEAGHVRHHHIPQFLGFAFVGWVLIAGLMEFLARWSSDPGGPLHLSLGSIETIGVIATVAFWGVGFGWVSRRFERQADLFGARCVTPEASECHGPCSLHSGAAAADEQAGRVCGTGAAMFASALNRVAALNGIPREEYSWRHSSIANRMRFLVSLAGDPVRAAAFQRMLVRLRALIVSTAVVGAIVCLAYWAAVPEPAILSLQAAGP